MGGATERAQEALARLLFCPATAPERDATTLAPLLRTLQDTRGCGKALVYLLASLQAAQLGMLDESDVLLWRAYRRCFAREHVDAMHDVLCDAVARADAAGETLMAPVAEARRFLADRHHAHGNSA